MVGGVVVGPEGTQFLTASAGNAQVTQMLTQIAAGMEKAIAVQAEQGVAEAVAAAKAQGIPAEQILALQEQAHSKASAVTVTVTDVVSGGGNAFAANLTMLPALIGGMMGGMLSILMVKRPAYRLITLVVAATGVGLIGAAVLGPWFDMIPGSYGMHALALGLGALGAHMPAGTVVSLMKSSSSFPAAATGGQWWTLILWAASGLVLVLIGAAIHAAKSKKQAPAVTA